MLLAPNKDATVLEDYDAALRDPEDDTDLYIKTYSLPSEQCDHVLFAKDARIVDYFMEYTAPRSYCGVATCSLSTTRTCETDDNCPGQETCENDCISPTQYRPRSWIHTYYEQWTVGGRGESCSTVCQKEGRTCSDTNTDARWRNEENQKCAAQALLQLVLGQSLELQGHGEGTLHNANSRSLPYIRNNQLHYCSAGAHCEDSTAQPIPLEGEVCSARHSDAQRLCFCEEVDCRGHVPRSGEYPAIAHLARRRCQDVLLQNVFCTSDEVCRARGGTMGCAPATGQCSCSPDTIEECLGIQLYRRNHRCSSVDYGHKNDETGARFRTLDLASCVKLCNGFPWCRFISYQLPYHFEWEVDDRGRGGGNCILTKACTVQEAGVCMTKTSFCTSNMEERCSFPCKTCSITDQGCGDDNPCPEGETCELECNQAKCETSMVPQETKSTCSINDHQWIADAQTEGKLIVENNCTKLGYDVVHICKDSSGVLQEVNDNYVFCSMDDDCGSDGTCEELCQGCVGKWNIVIPDGPPPLDVSCTDNEDCGQDECITAHETEDPKWRVHFDLFYPPGEPVLPKPEVVVEQCGPPAYAWKAHKWDDPEGTIHRFNPWHIYEADRASCIQENGICKRYDYELGHYMDKTKCLDMMDRSCEGECVSNIYEIPCATRDPDDVSVYVKFGLGPKCACPSVSEIPPALYELGGAGFSEWKEEKGGIAWDHRYFKSRICNYHVGRNELDGDQQEVKRCKNALGAKKNIICNINSDCWPEGLEMIDDGATCENAPVFPQCPNPIFNPSAE